jgi:hypothetical protein
MGYYITSKIHRNRGLIDLSHISSFFPQFEGYVNVCDGAKFKTPSLVQPLDSFPAFLSFTIIVRRWSSHSTC